MIASHASKPWAKIRFSSVNEIKFYSKKIDYTFFKFVQVK